jgi:MFS family permease
MGLYGVGFAMIQTPCVSAVSQIVPKSQIGVGTGMFMMIFFIGGAVGVATSMTALEFQAVDAVSWLGLELGAGARFSNALLLLTVMALVGLGFLPALPSRATLDAAKLSGLDQR